MKHLFKWRLLVASELGPRPTTRHILLTIALHMKDSGADCFPSVEKIARETGLSRRAVCLHLDLAEREGWIKKEICGFSGQGWKRHKYIPLIPEKVVTEGNHVIEKAVTEDNHVNQEGGYFHAEGGYFGDKKVVTEGNTNSTYNSPKNSPKYSPNSIESELSTLLFSLILQRHPTHKKPNLQKWAKQIDLAMRIDGRTELELRAVIEWSQEDSFWQNNILSTEKLRKHFDKLYMQMEGEKNGINRPGKTKSYANSRGTGSRSTKYSQLGTILHSTQ